MNRASLPPSLRDGILCLWFLVVAVGFWGGYVGLPTDAAILFYGIMLLLTIGVLALRLLSARGSGREETTRGK